MTPKLLEQDNIWHKEKATTILDANPIISFSNEKKACQY